MGIYFLMGKKINNTSIGKRGEREIQPVTRTQTIHLHKLIHKITFKNKAPKAVGAIRNYARRVMFTDDVRVDPELNQQIWTNGIRNVDRRVECVLERRKVEDDEDTTQKFYTLVRLAK